MRNNREIDELRQAALELGCDRQPSIAFMRMLEDACPFELNSDIVQRVWAYQGWVREDSYRAWVLAYALCKGLTISRDLTIVAEAFELTAYTIKAVIEGIESKGVPRVMAVLGTIGDRSQVPCHRLQHILPELIESSYEGEDLLRYTVYLNRLQGDNWRSDRIEPGWFEETIAQEVSVLSRIDLDFEILRKKTLLQKYDIPISEEVADWEDLRVAKTWYKVFGRMPKDAHLYELESWVVEGLKTSWKAFAKNLPACNEKHDKKALGYLVCAFGNKVVDILKARTESIHDLGINLAIVPDYEWRATTGTICQEAADWLYVNRKKRDWALLVRIAKSWEAVTRETDSRDVETLKAILESFTYDKVNHKGFALEAAKWGISQYSYESYEEKWLDGLRNRKSSNIPYVKVEEGDLRLETLAQDDPRGVFLGEHTNCCQHIEGAGSTCAWHGHEEGAFVTVFYGEQIVAQSWVWRYKDTVCFDNVEALGDWAERPELLSLYKAAAEQMLDRLGVDRVVVGGGSYDDLGVAEHFLKVDAVPTPVNCYTDAGVQYLIADLIGLALAAERRFA